MADSLPLAEQVGALRRALYRTVSARLARVTERPFSQLLALRVVAAGEVRTQAALAERLLVDAPAASRLVSRLVSDGLLTRKEGHDRRCTVLKITPAAKRELRVFEQVLAEIDAQVRRHVPAADYQRLIDQMAQLTDALSTPEQDGGPEPT